MDRRFYQDSVFVDSLPKEIERTRLEKAPSHNRYAKLDRIKYENGVEIIETANRIKFPISESDVYYTVPLAQEGRLDLISYQFYGSCLYWWAIAYASNIYDPFSVRAGDVVRIPSLTSIVIGNGVEFE